MCFTLQRTFSVPLNQPESHRRGRTLGLFSSPCIFFDAPPPPAVFASILDCEKGSAVPSLVDNEGELCQLTKCFSSLFTASTPRALHDYLSATAGIGLGTGVDSGVGSARCCVVSLISSMLGFNGLILG